MIPSQKSEYSRTFQVTGVNQNARRLLSTDLVNIKLAYFFSTTSFEPVIIVYASIDSVSGIIFCDFVANAVRIIFLPTIKHRQANYNLPRTIFCDIFTDYIF